MMDEGNERENQFASGDQVKPQIVWFNALGFMALHLMGLYGFWISITEAISATNYWSELLICMSGLGITVGGHRLFAHRSYKVHWTISLGFCVMHTIAGQNCLYVWVRDHRQHHKYSDTDADPHNSKRGFFFSHIGWLMMRKHPDIIEKGKTIDMLDMDNDVFVMFQKKYYKSLYAVMAIFIPAIIPVWCWGEDPWTSLMVCYFYRNIVTLNVTWAVNSWAHLYGYKPYDRRIAPAESLYVSILSQGEGWHNYHHCFPWDYRTSEYGFLFNNSTRVIDLLERFGLAHDLKEATVQMIRKKVARTGDGSHHLWGFGDKDMDQETYNQLTNKYKAD